MAELNAGQLGRRAESLEKILLDLWTGKNDTITINRHYEGQLKLAESMKHCKENPRPVKAGAEQEEWDKHYLAKGLKLEHFYSPLECMQVFLEACENRIKKEMSVDPQTFAKVVKVRRHLMPNTNMGGNRKEALMDCTLEFQVRIQDLPEKRWDEINSAMERARLPWEMYPCPRDMKAFEKSSPLDWGVITHTVHTKISNMSIAARGYHDDNMVPQERGTIAKLTHGRESDAVMGLRLEDAKHFAKDGEGKYLNLWSNEQKETAYLNHLCGLSRIEKTYTHTMDKDSGPHWDKERFGRIALFLEAEKGTKIFGKPRSGLLDRYREVLKQAKSRSGRRKISAMLHPVRSVSPSIEEGKLRRGRSLVEKHFDEMTSDLNDPESYGALRDERSTSKRFSESDQDLIELRVFYGGNSYRKPDADGNYLEGYIPSIMLGATCIGTLDGSAVRATSKDIGRDGRIETRVKWLMEEIDTTLKRPEKSFAQKIMAGRNI